MLKRPQLYAEAKQTDEYQASNQSINQQNTFYAAPHGANESEAHNGRD